MTVPRKLLVRVVGAPLLLAALGGILYWGHRLVQEGLPNRPLNVLVLLVWFLSILEFWAMCRGRGVAMPNPYLLALAACGGVYALTRLQGGNTPLGLEAAAVTLILLCILVFRFGKVTPEGAALSLLGFAYTGLVAFLLHVPVAPAVSTFYLLFLLACAKGSDMAAFVVGKSIGRHPMAPVVSPNKTWEGGIAGGLAGAAAGFAVLWWTPLKGAFAAVPVPALLGLALSVTIAAQVGDLVKSAFKRWAGVKDSGRLLPEFGGMLDMVDSFLVAGPVAHFATVLVLRASS